MILPLGDAPNPRGVPVITWALLLANVLVYFLITLPLTVAPADPSDPLLREYIHTILRSLPQHVTPAQLMQNVSAYDLFVFRYGFRPAAPHAANLLYSMFLHAGLAHLFGNMLFLWIYGNNVEFRLGAIPYLLAYLGTGVLATLFHMLVDLDSGLPLVGASGAISGVLGFYFWWFPDNRVKLLVLMFPWFMDTVYVSARLVLGMFVIVDNLLPLFLTRGVQSGGVAYGAHIGGFAAGLLLAWLIDRRQDPTPRREPALL